MIYATKQDIVDRYNEETLLLVFTRRLVDPDADDAAIAAALAAAIARALADASAELDSYIASYLPLAIVPPALVGYCVDIALYRGSDSVAVPEERRKRYEDAIRWASKVGAGTIKLQLPAGAEPAAATSTIQAVSPTPVFTRDSLERF